MLRPLNVLIIEDNEDDALLLVEELQRGEFAVNWKRVQKEEELREMLGHDWDIVLCDYTLPQFNAIKALDIIKKIKSDIPCIIVSGTIGEETAVAAMLAGAKDYFVKGRLTRLNAAIRRELAETENRLLKLKAESELRESEKNRWLDREEALKREVESRKKIELLYLEAQEANRTKDEFLHNLSHELRTPMNAITGWATLLVSGDCDPADYNTAFEAIYRNAMVQNKLIDDLLDLSRIAVGKLSLENVVVNLVSIIQTVLESIKVSAQAKKLNVDFHSVSPELVVQGDPTRLQEIVWNLLSNAVKFTPQGGNVTIVLSRSDGFAEIKVADNGEGIDPNFLPHLFERFRQADSSLTRRYGGLGLGLSIVRQLTELHGGQVEAQSQGIGKGAAFTVKIPLLNEKAQPDLGENRETGKEKINKDLTGVRILVVDDQPDILTLLDYYFKKTGATVQLASSGKEALTLIKDTDFDILLIDIEMPEMNGYELLREVRSYEQQTGKSKVPAIALTAHVSPEDVKQALLAGFDRHLAKPISPSKLTENVSSIIL